jgi:hypothetical protein
MELLKIEATEISAGFMKASIEGKGTPQEVSDRREAVVKKFLEKYFPFPFRIAKGNIIDSFGNNSASIDCLVLNPCHPYTVSNDAKYSIIFADGVDFAIEVKPDLSKVDEIERALKQIASVKRLKKQKTGVLGFLADNVDQIEASKRIPTFIFADKTYSDIWILIEKIVIYYEKEKTIKSEQFDFIVINNWGIVFNSKKAGYFQVNTTFEGIVFKEFGEATVGMFLFWLNTLPLSELRQGSSVLSHYISFDFTEMKTFHNLNERLSVLVD